MLAAIRSSPGIHAAEVARRLDVSRQLVSYHVGTLRERGLVEARENEQVHHLHPAPEDPMQPTEARGSPASSQTH
jgi:predicted transcriptional regulator